MGRNSVETFHMSLNCDRMASLISQVFAPVCVAWAFQPESRDLSAVLTTLAQSTMDVTSFIWGPANGPPNPSLKIWIPSGVVSYTHLRAHETDSYLVCRLLLEKKK